MKKIFMFVVLMIFLISFMNFVVADYKKCSDCDCAPFVGGCPTYCCESPVYGHQRGEGRCNVFQCYGKDWMCKEGACGATADSDNDCNICQTFDDRFCRCDAIPQTEPAASDGTSCCAWGEPTASGDRGFTGQWADDRFLCDGGGWNLCGEWSTGIWPWVTEYSRCNIVGDWHCGSSGWGWEIGDGKGDDCGSGKVCDGQGNCGTACGDGVEDSWEDCANCPEDYGKCDGVSCDSASECENNYCVHEICRSTSTYCPDNYCDSGDGETYANCDEDCLIEDILELRWTNMKDEEPISSADFNDTVRLLALCAECAGETVDFNVYEDDAGWPDGDDLLGALSATFGTNGKASVNWKAEWLGGDGGNGNEYYFKANLLETDIDSGILEVVDDVEDNSLPVAVISKPNYDGIYKFDMSGGIAPVLFEQASYDVDDVITTYEWDFDGGSPAESIMSNPGSIAYSSGGPKYITLTVTDSRGESDMTTVGILINEIGVNDAPLAIITSPEKGKVYGESVFCDASKSIDDNTADLLFTWYFNGIADPDHQNLLGSAGGASFTKYFDEAGSYSVAVMVDDYDDSP